MIASNSQPQNPPTAARLARRLNPVGGSAAAVAAAVTFVVSLGLAGCGGATSGLRPRSDAAAPSVTPGFSTPQDAVDGMYQDALAGDYSAACSYLVPAEQSQCLSGLSVLGSQPASTGNFTIRTAAIQGSEALVSVTGNMCAPLSPCVGNTNPSLGMPASPAQFQSSYQAAVATFTSSTVTFSPVPCTQIGGKWYVG